MHLESRIPVRVDFIPDNGNSLIHSHEFAEISIVTSGSARHLTNYSQNLLTLGSVLVLAPGQVHGFSEANNYGLVNIYYMPEWFLNNLQALQDIDHLVPLFFHNPLFLRPTAGEILHFTIDENGLQACLSELRDLQNENNRDLPQPLYLEACFIKCLTLLARAYAKSLNPLEGSRHLTDLHPAVIYALQTLEAHVANGTSPDMAGIAANCGLSLSYFCRLFKEHTGSNATAYFQHRRIHRASHKLITTKASVAEIAYSLGYADSAHFSRSFKEIKGISPRSYRNTVSPPRTDSAQT